MSPEHLTAEQHATIKELQQEIAGLELEADEQWAKFLKTRDEDCWDQVLAIESEIEMKGMIAYLPKAGERKMSKIQGLVQKIKHTNIPIGVYEARLRALDSINAWREDYKLPPLDRLPQGIPGDSHECTLARAFRMSLKDMGLTEVNAQVSNGCEIGLTGMNAGGEHVDIDGPLFGEVAYRDSSASAVIEAFDSWDYLDLVDTDVLKRHLRDDVLEMGYGMPMNEILLSERAVAVDDELTRRGETFSVELYDLEEGPRPVIFGVNSTRKERAAELTPES